MMYDVDDQIESIGIHEAATMAQVHAVPLTHTIVADEKHSIRHPLLSLTTAGSQLLPACSHLCPTQRSSRMNSSAGFLAHANNAVL